MSRTWFRRSQQRQGISRSAIVPLGTLALIGGLTAGVAPAAAAEPSPVVAIASTDSPARVIEKAATVTPSARQLAWQREELTAFVHFGPNTFTGREWGHGDESPNVFNPSSLDTDQWAATLKNAGFKKIILTAKHHEGMLLFPSAYSNYGVSSSSWMQGQGDVVKSASDSARKYGLKFGFYLSPADGHEYVTRSTGGTFGNGSTPRAVRIPSIGTGNGTYFDFVADDYNRYYMNTLYELLTKYGDIAEVWLDGANPWPDAPQSYNFNDWVRMIRTLQPNATVFQDRGPDVRWVGNEAGVTYRDEWSALPYNTDYLGNLANPATAADTMLTMPYGNSATNLAGDAVLSEQVNGASKWKLLRWQPAECDGRLQAPYWFWNTNARAQSLAALQNIYFNSVGKNCQLLLNVAPDNTGRFPADAVSRMQEFGAWIRALHAANAAAQATAANDTGTSNTTGNSPANVLDTNDGTAWQPTGTTGGLVLDLGSAKTFNVVNLQENIQVGQRVASFAIDTWTGSAWQQAATGTTIGYRRLLKLGNTITAQKVRLRITASRALPPAIATFTVHQEAPGTNLALNKPATQSSTLAGSGAVAGRAVDGNTNGSFPAGSVTHTADAPLDNNPWWQVDLGSSQHVSTVTLFNRTDCCADRLRNFRVFGSDAPFTSTDPNVTAAQAGVWSIHRVEAAGTSLTLSVGRTARYLRVQLIGNDRPLSLAEVQVRGNLAIDGVATQSSVLAGSTAVASKAIDGNTDGNYPAGSVTHTAIAPLDNNPWWHLDLGSIQNIGSVTLFNRTDCCSDRLRSFHVFASDTPFTSTDPATTAAQPGVWKYYQATSVGTTLTLPVNRTARYLRVQLVGNDRPLSLAEVRVLGGSAVATQSSVLAGSTAVARKAIDGNTDGNYPAGSVTHTADAPLDNNPWWQLDLGASQQVGSVTLFNRTDCCSDRLRNLHVFASDTPFTSTDPATTAAQPGVWKYYQATSVGTTLTLPVNRTARYLRVQLIGNDRPLSLAEVRITG